jgi:hypothetical protein
MYTKSTVPGKYRVLVKIRMYLYIRSAMACGENMKRGKTKIGENERKQKNEGMKRKIEVERAK